jgi:hypothetical protein
MKAEAVESDLEEAIPEPYLLQWTNDFNYDDHSVLLSVESEIFKVRCK